jgi:hypothetical protein
MSDSSEIFDSKREGIERWTQRAREKDEES